MTNEEISELTKFKEAAYEGDTKRASEAVKEIAKIENTNKVSALFALHFTFSDSPRVIQVIESLILEELED